MTRKDKINLALTKGISYNPLTGEVFGVSGKVLSKKCNKYIAITLWNEGKRNYLYAHQFAYFVEYGKTPKYIDHINRDKNDNRICNLREVTAQVNALNTDAIGVSFDKSGNKWVAAINLNNKKNVLGRFEKRLDAINKYKEYKQEIIKNHE